MWRYRLTVMLGLSALNRKLIRDLLHMKGQALAIGLVMACGVATFVMSVSTLQSLVYAKDTYYSQYRFAHVFAHLKRAPNWLRQRIQAIPGVQQVQTRVVAEVNLDVPGMTEPAAGRIISVSDRSADGLNQLHLRSGRFIEPGRADEALVTETFADAHGFRLGDSVTAIINGRMQALRIVGIVLSPEYVYQIRPGELLPDDRRFGVFWMSYDQLAPAFDMDGAFNDIALSLTPDAIEQQVIDQLDRLTERYGGLGAYGREDHPSNRFVSNEIDELRGMALIAPSIFLGVAAFLLNVVIARLINTQREQIAMLKAFGFTRREVGWHYLKLMLLIAFFGAVTGIGVGMWLGQGLTQLYTRFFHFPVFTYRIDAWVVILAAGISAGAAILGTIGAVTRAMRLPPAEAMRPEPPATFRPTFVERIGLQRLLPPVLRMILRQIERSPIRSALTCVGIGLAAAVLVLGSFMLDAINYAIDLEFHTAQRQDMTVLFVEPRSRSALHEIQNIPGVIHAEPFRALSTRFISGHRTRRVGIMGLEADAQLFRLVDINRNPVQLPPEGLVLSAKLAELLDVGVGQYVTVEVLEESRPVREVPVTALIEDFAGTSAYMNIDALNRLMRQGHVLSGVYLSADELARDAIFTTLKKTPMVASVTIKQAMLTSFHETVAENILRMRTFNVLFACIIAFGVVYNSMRISFSERSRELATLRVIGFTRTEASLILLGEMAILTLIAIPLGLLLGYSFAALTTLAYNTELFRIPLVVERSTYGFATVVVAIAALVSGLIVRHRVDRLDLVSVLKTRE